LGQKPPKILRVHWGNKKGESEVVVREFEKGVEGWGAGSV